MMMNSERGIKDQHKARFHHPFLPSLAQQMLMKSESEESATPGPKQLEKQLSNNSNNALMSSNTTLYSSMFGSRLDDEDPVFSLDEEVRAKEEMGERTRHYTADFDPTVSDDDVDDFAKGVENLHGGRAYSTSHRFPPRTRHSGRSGQNTCSIHQQQQQQKFHVKNGLSSVAVCGGGVVPASLPIAITRGINWPPRELVGSLSEEEEASNGEVAKLTASMSTAPKDGGTRALLVNPLAEMGMATEADNKKCLDEQGSEREDDLYGRIQAYSRSIQPADDPERLFGERPRRRHTLREGNSIDGDPPPLPPPSLVEQAVKSGGEGGSGGENIPPSALNAAPSAPIPAAVAHDLNNPPQRGAEGTSGTPRIIVPTSLTAAR